MSDYTKALQAQLDQLLLDATSGRLSPSEIRRCDDLLFQARLVLEDFVA